MTLIGTASSSVRYGPFPFSTNAQAPEVARWRGPWRWRRLSGLEGAGITYVREYETPQGAPSWRIITQATFAPMTAFARTLSDSATGLDSATRALLITRSDSVL